MKFSFVFITSLARDAGTGRLSVLTRIHVMVLGEQLEASHTHNQSQPSAER